LIEEVQAYGARHLLDVCAHLHGQMTLALASKTVHETQQKYPDLSDVVGQSHAKRALVVAAAGQHSLLFSGSPGTGKTMLASRLPGILPDMDEQEAVQTATVHSISVQGFKLENWLQRPFRAPHHTASAVALVGGGSQPKPGEISLAHNGVLFLDELPEFDRRVLEVLREPIESGTIHISRAANQAEFPARFQLVAAMNPCPCGYLGETRCRCTEDQIQRYRAKVSGPLMDRIDMLVDVPTATKEIFDKKQQAQSESSATLREKVQSARKMQLSRQAKTNNHLNSKEIELVCKLDSNDTLLIERAITQLGLSMRAYHRILKVARTIADLAGSENIQTAHITEAIGYRRLKIN
jgi:magnesium chelatase family protein